MDLKETIVKRLEAQLTRADELGSRQSVLVGFYTRIEYSADRVGNIDGLGSGVHD